MDDSSGVRRRRILTAAGVVALAGCNDGGSTPTTDSATASERPTTTSPPDTPTQSESATPTPAVSITDVSITPQPVGQFQPAEVTVTVTNEGARSVEGVVDLDLAGELLTLLDVAVGPGDTATVSETITRGMVGESTVRATVRAPGGPSFDRQTARLTVEPYPPTTVETDGTRLLCGGQPVQFGGASLANAFAPENNRASEASLVPAFDALADLGVSSARIWGFAPSWADISSMPAPGEYNDVWFDYFDRVVVAAKQRDIRLFVPLINGNPAYGPVTPDRLSVNVPQFVRWADDAETRNDFFTSEDCWRLFTGWVERLVTNENHLTGVEYRNDPTIAMWELGNEIQHSPPRVGESIRPWIDRAGRYLTQLDDQTLVTTGSYGHQGRNAFVEEASADPIDVASIHYYPGPEHYDLPESEVIPTLTETIRTTRAEIGKPLYVGEYNWGVGPEDTAPFTERIEWLGRLHDRLESAGVAATNLHTVAVEQRPTSFHKRATVYAPNEEGTLQQIAAHARRTREASESDCV